MSYKLIKAPNLPENKVKHCLIGEKYTEEIKELEALGINCIQLNNNVMLEEEINSHADMLSCNLGNGKILLNHGTIGEEQIKEIGYTPLFVKGITSPYPEDVSLNCAVINNKFICNKKYTNTAILEFANQNNGQVIHTNQGYAKCNLCVVNNNAVITEDKGLACLLKKCQFNVLLINPGDVYLSDKHNGFLGGASGKISQNEMYFSGDLSAHSDFKRIIEFLDKYNVKPLFNNNRTLKDFGGFIPLTEYL